MLFQLNPSSSMIINRARLTSAAGETRDRVNDTNTRRSSLVRLKTDCMLHIVLLKSMLHNTNEYTDLSFAILISAKAACKARADSAPSLILPSVGWRPLVCRGDSVDGAL